MIPLDILWCVVIIRVRYSYTMAHIKVFVRSITPMYDVGSNNINMLSHMNNSYIITNDRSGTRNIRIAKHMDDE